MARSWLRLAMLGAAVAWVLGMWLSVEAAQLPPGARVYLTNGESFPASQLVYRNGTLVVQLPYGQLTFSQEQLSHLAWGAVDEPAQALSQAILLVDGSRLTGAAVSMDEQGAVAKTPYGTLIVSDLARLRSIGFGRVDPLPQGQAPIFQFFLKDGDIVHGRVAGADGRTVIVESPYGTLHLPDDRLSFFRSRVFMMPARAGQVDFSNGDRVRARLPEVRGAQWIFQLDGGQLLVDRPEAVARVSLGSALQPVRKDVPALSSSGYGEPRLTGLQLATGPNPRGLAVTADGKRLYVANWDGDSLSVYDLVSTKKIADIPVGRGPWGVALSPDERFVYATIYHEGRLAVVDTGSQRKVADIPTGSSPLGLAVSPDGLFTYVANSGSKTVSILDAVSHRKLSDLPLDFPPLRIALSADGRTAYVAMWEQGKPAAVAIVELPTGKVVAHIGDLASAQFIVPHPDGRLAYVTDAGGITVLDLAVREKVGSIPLGGEPFGAALSPDGRFLYVANRGTGVVSIIDAQTLERRFDIPVGPAQLVAFSPDGRTAYVTVAGDRPLVAVIDTGKGRVVGDLILRWEGPPVEGILTFLSPDYVFVANEEGEQRIPLAEVKTIHFQRRSGEAGP